MLLIILILVLFGALMIWALTFGWLSLSTDRAVEKEAQKAGLTKKQYRDLLRRPGGHSTPFAEEAQRIREQERAETERKAKWDQSMRSAIDDTP